MTVTNQERVREFRGTSMQVFGGGTFTAVNLHVHVMNFTIDALATVHATLKGEHFVYNGMFNLLPCTLLNWYLGTLSNHNGNAMENVTLQKVN